MAWLHGYEMSDSDLVLSIISSKYCVSGPYLLSYFNLKHIAYRRLDSVSVFRWNLLCWAQWIELVPISGHQLKISYINQTLCAGVVREGLALSIGPNRVSSTWKWKQNADSQILHILNKNRMTDNVRKLIYEHHILLDLINCNLIFLIQNYVINCYEIWGSCRSRYEDYCLLWYDIMQSGRNVRVY
jgi:hypothetical protein